MPFGVTKALVVGGLVVASAAEPLVNPEPDLVRFAIQQGIVATTLLIVLWFYRRDYNRFQAKDEERLTVVTDLAERMTTAVEHSAAATTATKESVDRLSRALEGRP